MKKILLTAVLIVIMVMGAGCGTPVQESTSSAEPEGVYTGVSDTDIIYGIQLMEQVCCYSEYEAVEKLGIYGTGQDDFYSLQIDTLFNKTGNMNLNCYDDEVMTVAWYHDFNSSDPKSSLVLAQLYDDILRVLEEELYVSDAYEGDMGGYYSFTCEYNGRSLMVDKYYEDGLQIYIYMTEY